MLTIPALTILSKFDILYRMIKLITYLINRLTEFREYLIERSIPKSQTHNNGQMVIRNGKVNIKECMKRDLKIPKVTFRIRVGDEVETDGGCANWWSMVK